MKIQLVVFGVIGAVAGLFAGLGSVDAHARLKESTPKLGEVLQASPTEVSITFTNDIQRISGTYGISVTDEAGASVTAGAAVIDDDEDRSIMSVALSPGLAPGRYVVKYKNVSDADGDPFEAGFAFYVGVEPTAEQRAEDELLNPSDIVATQTFVARQTTTPSAGGSETSTPPGSPAVTPPANGGGDGGGNSVVIGAIAAVVAGAVIGFFGVRWFAGRRA